MIAQMRTDFCPAACDGSHAEGKRMRDASCGAVSPMDPALAGRECRFVGMQ